MSVEENKANARRFYEEVFNQGNLAAIDELSAPNIVDHTAMPDQSPGTEGLKQMIGMYLSAFPNLHLTVDAMIGEGDMVSVLSTVTGTHTADMMGIPPTGQADQGRRAGPDPVLGGQGRGGLALRGYHWHVPAAGRRPAHGVGRPRKLRGDAVSTRENKAIALRFFE